MKAYEKKLGKLRNICEKIEEKQGEKQDEHNPKNKIFYAVNMHGTEKSDDFVIPENVRIIMFCYSGRELKICPTFDLKNWRDILLNEDASFNYCTFITSLVHSTLRDHFCVYNPGHTIKDIMMNTDPDFRSGIFKLPVKAVSVKDISIRDEGINEGKNDNINEHNTAYISSSDIFSDVSSLGFRNIKVDRQQVAKDIRYRESDMIIMSYYKSADEIRLSRLVKELLAKHKGFTLLLLTCRQGLPYNLEKGNRVYEEVEMLYEKYRAESKG
jgi:hypothetical protein